MTVDFFGWVLRLIKQSEREWDRQWIRLLIWHIAFCLAFICIWWLHIENAPSSRDATFLHFIFAFRSFFPFFCFNLSYILHSSRFGTQTEKQTASNELKFIYIYMFVLSDHSTLNQSPLSSSLCDVETANEMRFSLCIWFEVCKQKCVRFDDK